MSGSVGAPGLLALLRKAPEGPTLQPCQTSLERLDASLRTDDAVDLDQRRRFARVPRVLRDGGAWEPKPAT
jgi:hypothetical protein